MKTAWVNTKASGNVKLSPIVEPVPLGMHRLPALKGITTRGGRPRYARCAAKRTENISGVKKGEKDPSPFFEPLLRSFVLGLGGGIFCEVAHVAYKFCGLIGEVGSEKVLQVIPTVVDRFSPLFVVDHVAAVGTWAFLYAIEVVAVASVLNQFAGDKEKVADELRRLVTLPKRMLPMRLHSFKSLILSLFVAPSPAVAATGPGLSKGTTSGGTTGSTVAFPRSIPKEPSGGTKPERIPVSGNHVVVVPNKKLPLPPTEPSSILLEKRRKELRERKSFLRNFWYAIALSDNIGTDPEGVEVLSMNLVLFRGEDGVVRCLRDSCPHRSAPLSMGWTQTVHGHDCVVCPYHGWAIDEAGCIQDVPAAEGDGQWPKSPQVDAFVVEERGGFVWLFYEGPKGNRLPADERPPIPLTPELEDPNWAPVYGELEFNCGHWAVFENAIDMAHIHYLHGDTFGNQDKPKVMNMTATSDAYGITSTFDIHNKPVSPIWNFTAVESVPVTAQAFLPSTSMIKITLGAGVEFITYVCTCPINENKCINRFALIRNFLPWPADVWEPWARNAMFKILGEDKVMVEKLRPEETIREVSVRADLPQIAFRKLRQEYIDMGYGYLPQSLDANLDMKDRLNGTEGDA